MQAGQVVERIKDGLVGRGPSVGPDDLQDALVERQCGLEVALRLADAGEQLQAGGEGRVLARRTVCG